MKVFMILNVFFIKLKVGTRCHNLTMQCNSLIMIVSSLFSLPPPTSGASVAPPAQNLTTTAGGLTTAGCDDRTIRIVL